MSSTVTDKGLFEYALMQPRFSANAPDTLRIVSGYATHAMAALPKSRSCRLISFMAWLAVMA